MKKIRIWAVLFWLLLWQAGSMLLAQEIFLVSPIRVVGRLFSLVREASFWQSILFSSVHIGTGFLLAALVGVLLAVLASRYGRIKELLAPAMLAVKTVPVASFIILILIWFSSRKLSALISFLMVLPVVYTNTLNGIEAIPKAMVEMAEVFAIPAGRRLRYLYTPSALPFFYSACEIGLGLCWKSGIAAEVIGMPVGSIGEKLQQAKVYLDTPDLFAWTLVIVTLSVFFEKLFLLLLKKGSRLLEGISVKSVKFDLRAVMGQKTGGIDGADMPNYADREGILVQGLSKRYGEKTVLEGFTAAFPPGEVSCIMAPSGRGKTTLMRILMGLENADEGSLTGLTGKRLSAVFQEDRLCGHLNPAANIRLTAVHAKEEQVREAMKSVDLTGCEHQPVRELSGGMKRRVALLRALLSQHEVLFLDEPFKGLDAETKEKVMRYTKESCQGATVILVTHDPGEAEFFSSREPVFL